MAAAPHYKATVIHETKLYNAATKKWVYTLPVGKVLEVRSATYEFNGIPCYPVVGPYPYINVYFVPKANVRLSALAGTLLDAWLAFARSNTGLQQFGQAADVSTFNGATGCTHTILQRLIKAKTGAAPSHDDISKIASYPWPSGNPGMRGLYSGGSDDEVGRVINHYDLPYKIVFGWSWAAVLDSTFRGPVMIGVRYGWWPEWRDFVYNGTRADGRPNGYAASHGKTQLYGFEAGFHASLLLGHVGSTAYANEPNHGSASRPERPNYDILTVDQARRAYDAYSSTGRSPLAWVPTSTFRPRGY